MDSSYRGLWIIISMILFLALILAATAETTFFEDQDNFFVITSPEQAKENIGSSQEQPNQGTGSFGSSLFNKSKDDVPSNISKPQDDEYFDQSIKESKNTFREQKNLDKATSRQEKIPYYSYILLLINIFLFVLLIMLIIINIKIIRKR